MMLSLKTKPALDAKRLRQLSKRSRLKSPKWAGTALHGRVILKRVLKSLLNLLFDKYPLLIKTRR